MDSYSTSSHSQAKTTFGADCPRDTSSFLEQLHLCQYIPSFIDEGFETISALLEITETDLIALNVKRGHRRIIQRGIATMNGVPSHQPLATGTVPNYKAITPTQPPAPAPKIINSGSNSSEGSCTTSGYGSMNSSNNQDIRRPRYETSNSGHYTSGTSYLSNTPPKSSFLNQQENGDQNNTCDKSQKVNNTHYSSYSSQDEAGMAEQDNMDNALKRKYRRHPKADRNAPVKPPSAYIMFSNDARAELKNHNLTFVEIAKIVGDQWKNLGSHQKQRYERIAMKAKDEYHDALNAYRQTNTYREYETYLNNFKSEQDATNRKIARLRKKAKCDLSDSGSMASSSLNGDHRIKNRCSESSLGSSGSNESNGENRGQSSSSSNSNDIYKVHLKNNPPLPSIITTRDENRVDDPQVAENNGNECYSPQQKAPPPLDEDNVESNYRPRPLQDRRS